MPRSTERGFILMSALWLLLLGASLAGLLMTRAVTASREAKAEADGFAADQAYDDAIEAIAADLVFDGPRSRWANTSLTDIVKVDGRSLPVRISSEQALPDVNKADLKLIDVILNDRGYSAAVRGTILARIATDRANGTKLASLSDVAALATGLVAPGEEACLAHSLSPFGNAVPAGGSDVYHSGSVLRLTFGTGAPHKVFALRIVAANDHPYGLLDAFDDSCSGPSSGSAAA